MYVVYSICLYFFCRFFCSHTIKIIFPKKKISKLKSYTIKEHQLKLEDKDNMGVTSRPQLADRQFHEKLVSGR